MISQSSLKAALSKKPLRPRNFVKIADLHSVAGIILVNQDPLPTFPPEQEPLNLRCPHPAPIFSKHSHFPREIGSFGPPGNPGLPRSRTAAQIAGTRPIRDLFRNSCGGSTQQQKAGGRKPQRLRAGSFLYRRGINKPAAPDRPQNKDTSEKMSDDKQNSRNSGDSRRRRSRGGQNRNRNNNNNSNRRSSNGRQSGGGRRDGGRRQGGPKQGAGKQQRRPMPKPIELTWWQKLLKSVGLYKEPVRPPRPERRPDATGSKKTREPRRAKTRDVRNGGAEASSKDEPRRGKRRERDKNRPRGGDPSTVENRRVYVGNISYETTESDLEELFKGVGAVRRVEIVYNRKTHRSKGYGFIEMIDVDEAKRTVEVLHDQFFMGRQLTVSGAKSKDHEEAEKEEPINEAQNSTIPPLAPINPNKEETLDLIDETPKESPTEEATVEISEEETHAKIPTEEFSPVADAPEEAKDQAKA